MHLIEISIAIDMHVDVSMQREGDMCMVEGRKIDVSIHRTGWREARVSMYACVSMRACVYV